MRVELNECTCTLTREPDDKLLARESQVIGIMRRLLNAQGFHFVRYDPTRESLTGCELGLKLGLIDRKLGVTLWHERYMIEKAEKEYNRSGSVTFSRVNRGEQ
jgi:hypothetical protein